jgi:hypothetical protein
VRPSKLELLTSLGVGWERLPGIAVSKYIARDYHNRGDKRDDLVSVANLILMESLPVLKMSHGPEQTASWLLRRIDWGLSKWEKSQRCWKRGGMDLLLGEDPRLLLEETYADTTATE